MALIDLEKNEITAQGQVLETPEIMLEMLKLARSGGYTGNIDGSEMVDGVEVWRLYLNHPATSTTQSGVLGDWFVIENNAIARIMSPDQGALVYRVKQTA